ncbi:carboxyvinyl-carboxyphosphonate phosphorylmutase [Capsulimonas corticalis]|uniref:Carboxyvinyl-carboxyphosphonate phosphorylmutase n=1 Tax=Capsulimonas corticalis TaxID=2219043 RepID=A0A402D2H0_9BACT|nr:isocitrate lyase/phosphoenolpyruvate mutase family protein [Capsulimonas corticalis]BDI30009.1 carboxyvinyl-carboxyphosphonate phosphorylmutase [Capsulimonas corticalis]
MTTQREKAIRLRELHQGPRILALPNVWDCAGARLVEEAGFSVVATASASMSWSLGYPDGQSLPREEMLFMVRRIAATAQVPVTVDIEAGYGANSVSEVIKTAQGVLDAGAVGINLEDGDGDGGLTDIAFQSEKIIALRALGEFAGIPIVINARTDVFHAGILEPDEQFPEAVRRLNAYRAAGADCLFAPFVTDAPMISALVRDLHGPLNILAMPGMPSLCELEAMGVRRVSTGPALFLAAATTARRMAEHLREDGVCRTAGPGSIIYPEMNRLMMRVTEL